MVRRFLLASIVACILLAPTGGEDASPTLVGARTNEGTAVCLSHYGVHVQLPAGWTFDTEVLCD